LNKEISCDVFRPNFVVEELSYQVNDKSIQTSESLFLQPALMGCFVTYSSGLMSTHNIPLVFQGPCQRCSMINVDTSTGKLNSGLYQMIMSLEKMNLDREEIQSMSLNKIYFGDFYIYETKEFMNLSKINKIFISYDALILI
jgi:hypothetical protein